MTQRLGNVIYWAASGVAVLFVLLGVLMARSETSPSNGIVAIVAYSAIGGLIWLAGEAVWYVLAG